MLRWLLCDIGGAPVTTISTVEFTNHYGPADPNHMGIDQSFFLVNDSHVLLLSTEANPDSGKERAKLMGWDNSGISIVPVCCEELPVRWHRVERDSRPLVSWGSNPDIAHLSLKELSSHPIFYREGASRHPFLDEFHRSLVAVVTAEQRFESLPPKQWDQQAWQGFYRLLVRSLGGRLFYSPLGKVKPPFCKMDPCQTSPNFAMTDSTLRINFDENPLLPISNLLRMRLLTEHDLAKGLGLKPDDFVYEVDVCRSTLHDKI